MTASTPNSTSPDLTSQITLHYEVERFLHREADLLDAREFETWLTLLADDLRYWMPLARNFSFGAWDQEYTREGKDLNWFDEGKFELTQRVKQILTGKHWAEEPISRTSHMLSNLEVTELDDALVGARCRFLVYRNRTETEWDLFVGKRDDELRRVDGSYQIARRKIYLDQNVLLAKNLTLFFDLMGAEKMVDANPRNPEHDREILTDAEDRVGVITLNRPEVLNAFTDAMRPRLLEALESYENDAEIRCVVITGAGNAFCAGGDVASMVKLQDENDTGVVESRMAVGGQVVQLLRRMSKPVIAAVNGAAAGGGMNLALACDLRIGSEQALFSESFVKIGLVPDWGGFYFLTRLLGTAKAMELMLTGDRIRAADALRLGLLNQVHPTEQFWEQVMAFARKIAAGPPATMARIKEGVYLGASASLAEALAFEHQAQKSVFLSDDAREGMRAFVAKRPPAFDRKRSGPG